MVKNFNQGNNMIRFAFQKPISLACLLRSFGSHMNVYTAIPSYPGEICSKTPSGSLKAWIVLIYIYMCIYIYNFIGTDPYNKV